ncbi:MAG: elongation factor P [Planctomycetes bacterium]|nr:elongation factor P [Planctomycetota bacterium]MCB9907157.1 elongation factor P [Planctomycetota bacterium]MCB9908982.1 elongation factor P [Planctomycetota bacterium]MCB9911771.1 elongation factor P [Planctomycetota bacterium]HPF15907.1 elongation factor P [Planctomycetota bacterium]
MIDTSGFKKGVCLVYRGEPVIIVDYTVSSPTARGGNTIFKTKLRHLKTGQLLNESIRSGEKFDEVDVERHDASYLYSDGAGWHFMDDETFEQFAFSAADLAGSELYLVDGIQGVQAMLIDGVVASIELPMTVTMTAVECDPTIKGATAQAQLKPAKTETGLIVQVPPYLAAGEKFRVDTRDGHFIERAKE